MRPQFEKEVVSDNIPGLQIELGMKQQRITEMTISYSDEIPIIH